MKYIALDTETTGLETWDPNIKVTHISWFTDTGKGGVYKVGKGSKKVFKQLKKIAASNQVTKLFWNAKFDIQMLRKVGIKVASPVIDVMILGQLTKQDEPRYNLKHFARKFLNFPFLEEKKLKEWLRSHKGKSYGEAPDHILYPYTLADAKCTLELFFRLYPILKSRRNEKVLDDEMKLLRTVIRMEKAGVPVSKEAVEIFTELANAEMRKLKKKMVKLTKNPTFNPNSHKQVSEAVYDGTVMPVLFSHTTGKPKVDETALLLSPSKLGSLVIRYRKLAKAKTTYLKNFLHTDAESRIHPSLNQTAAKTGRFSCSNPNLQNIPRPEDSILGRMRSCIRAPKNYALIFNDFDQIEIKLAAIFTQETHMLEAISEGKDLHGITATKLFNKNEDSSDWNKWRYLAKKLNFAILYGVGASKFALTVLKDTEGDIRLTDYEAAKYIELYKAAHPKVMDFFIQCTNEVRSFGGIRTWFDRYIECSLHKAYASVNYYIQGTAADLLKRKLIEISHHLTRNKYRTKMILTIHDEIVYLMPKEETYLIQELVEMQEERKLWEIPITVSPSAGKTWATKKSIDLDEFMEQ